MTANPLRRTSVEPAAVGPFRVAAYPLTRTASRIVATLSIAISVVLLACMLTGCSASTIADSDQSANHDVNALTDADSTDPAGSKADAQTEPALTTGPLPITRDTELNCLCVDMAEADFAALGFQLGDSVDIALSNGKTYEDVPYHDGSYVLPGGLVLAANEGDSCLKLKRNQDGSIWDECGASETDSATVTLREAGKYVDVQKVFTNSISMTREDFASDEAFANFRPLSGGHLCSDLVYRSSSPIDDGLGRAAYANKLAAAVGIRYSLDLADSEKTFLKYAEANGAYCQFYTDLHAAGKVETLGLTADFSGDTFKHSIAAGLVRMCQQPGPYLIHCLMGKDRAGFACMLIEALAGATVDELVADYMISYTNYFGITQQSTPDTYDAVVSVLCYNSLLQLAYVDTPAEVNDSSVQAGAVRYLSEGGLTDEQIAQIRATLCA